MRRTRPEPPRAERLIKPSLFGQTRGLKASQKKALQRLGERRIKSDVLVTPELAQQLVTLSMELKRAIGVLVDRRGRVVTVALGDARRVYLPDLGRARGGGSRFRGLRFVRTRLGGDNVSQDDLTDLARLRLDAVVVVDATDANEGAIHWVHLVPDNPEGERWSIQRARHASQLDVPFSIFIRELEAEFEAAQSETVSTGADVAMLVYVRTREDYLHTQNLAELHELCRTAGVTVVETYVQSRAQLDAKYAVGSGALEELELRALQLGAEILIFGQDLSPAQMRGITERTQLRVVDRTQLILDIFAQRAQSRVGKLQVELAQLTYRLPRLAGRGTAMSRLGGGVGGRGPGETKLETDRRLARDRIANLNKGIRKLRNDRELRRKARRQRGVPVIALVGYTNAGKSTLLNSLTRSNVLSEDKLFATLDPTSRRLRFPHEREVVLTDTVGFIRDLPAALKEAFRATLEELEDADLLLHIVDASDANFREQIRSTEQLLHELEYSEIPRIRVYNKVDLLSDDDVLDLRLGLEGVFASATDRRTSKEVLDAIDRWLIGRGDAARVQHWDDGHAEDGAAPEEAR